MTIERFCFIDVETTGLDEKLHEIIEIGAILTDRNLNTIVEWECKVFPEHIETASQKALDINGYTEDLWAKEAMSLTAALKAFNHICHYSYLAGHNVNFDKKFLEASYKKVGIKPSWNTYHVVDTVSMAMPLFVEDQISRFSLKNLCEYFDIENEKAHTALSDIRATLEVARKLICITRNVY